MKSVRSKALLARSGAVMCGLATSARECTHLVKERTRRINVLLGNPYKELIGFSRAVRVGPFISVGGTAPIGDDGETVGIGEIAAQTRRCFEIIEMALESAGAGLSDVVRTRMMFTDLTDFQAAAAVRREYVGEYKPVDTIVQVARFVNPDWLIEVEADAVVAD